MNRVSFHFKDNNFLSYFLNEIFLKTLHPNGKSNDKTVISGLITVMIKATYVATTHTVSDKNIGGNFRIDLAP